MKKPEVSVVIPNKDDANLLPEVVKRLNSGIKQSRFEIIIVDDGSQEPPHMSIFEGATNVTIIYKPVNRGVGQAFDTGVQAAQSDTILLLGSDVLVKYRTWLDDVKRNVRERPKAFTCAACVGVNPDNMYDHDWSERTRRYGADLMFTIGVDDLPKSSPLRKNVNHRNIFECTWIRKKRHEGSYEIPALLGTCYCTTKRAYEHIGGWGSLKKVDGLTKEEKKWYGMHRYWGGLEGMVSLKIWFSGLSCRVDSDWETAHVFSRPIHRSFRLNMFYYNKLLIAYSLFPSEQAKIFDDFLGKGKNENEARMFIKRNWNAIMAEKAFNDANKVHGVEIFANKFGYKLDWLHNE